MNAIHHFDHIGTRLTLDVENDRGCRVEPRAKFRILCALLDDGHVGQADGRPVLVGNDRSRIVRNGLQLVVSIDGKRLRWPVEVALGRVHVEVGDGGAQIIEIETVGSQCLRIGPDPHRRALAAGNADEANACDL